MKTEQIVGQGLGDEIEKPDLVADLHAQARVFDHLKRETRLLQ